jgi:hypothetical protein
LAVLLGTAAALLAVGPAAVAEPRHYERSVTELITDGSRFVAWQPQAGSLVVRDEARGSSRALTAGDDCRVRDGHRGVFLVDCSRVPFLSTPRSRALKRVVGFGTAYDPQSESMVAVGRYWLKGTGMRSSGFYVNWHTGERRQFGSGPERDLDSRTLKRLPRNVVYVSKRITVKFRSRELVAERRGKRALTLDPCNRGCHSVSGGGGLVTWARDATAYGYVVSTGQRLRWKLRTTIADAGHLFFGVQHTRRNVYFNVPESEARPATFDVRRERWVP